MPPALQSTVIALSPANSVGGGSGTPTAGNWLVILSGWNQNGIAPATVADADDIHSYWRPAKTSPASGNTRCSAWYTANLARVATDTYIAPTSAVAGMACLVLELAGTGPWDTITGVTAAYAAGATSLNLALPAPSASSFVIAAICGDSDIVSQAFAPAGWTALHTVTATNGVDHTCDAVLTSAILPSTTSSVSVNGTTSGASDLSGVILALQINAPSPIPAGANPAWAGRMVYEIALGAGYQTPPDQLVYTPLSDSAAARGTTKRAWSFSDSSGPPYALGQLQSGSGNLQLDNADGNLTPSNVGSVYYSTAINANMSFNMVAPYAGVTPWTGHNGAALAQSSSFAFASSATGKPIYSLAVTPDGITANPAAWSEYVPVTALSTYSASAWFYIPGGYGSGAEALIGWFDASHAFLSASFATIASVPAAAWTQVSVTSVTAPASAAYAVFAPQLLGTPSAATVFYLAEAALVAGSSLVQTGLVTTGTPVRLRAALGTIGGTTYNRWYTISRFALSWDEKRSKTLRNYVDVSTTDIWSVVAASCPSAYRGEVEADNPASWYPMDDGLLAGGVLPSSLRNAAAGNTNTLVVHAASGGVTAGDAWTTDNIDATSTGGSTNPAPPNVAVYSVASDQGWMYGDPQSSPQSYATGNPVTANPGSASWSQTGLAGNTGANGWFLAVNDTTLPPLANGMTFSLWFKAAFFGSATGWQNPSGHLYHDLAGQPYSVITLATLATASAPVALLQLDLSGHLVLITYNGTTPTSTTIYSSSDLRSASWHNITITTTTTAWHVYVDGGLTASVSGTATGMTSAWSWLVLNGDMGTSGGSSLSSQQHGGNVAYSHCEIYPRILPAWRILAHYYAAICGCGLLPAPQSIALSAVLNPLNTQASYVPDGSAYQGNYGKGGFSGAIAPYSFTGLAVAQAGTYTSGPSARAVIAGQGGQTPTPYGNAVWMSWAALAPSVMAYTAAGAGSETNAATACGSGDAFTAGFGGGATGVGVCQTAAGTGASPPSSPSALGDSVGQRLERILGYGGLAPPRAIDPAPLAVQAALDVGGQQTGASIQNIVDSDNGMLFVDNNGALCYRMKSHLAADAVVWNLSSAGPSYGIPFKSSQTFSDDPQRVWTAITVSPYSPDGASLPVITPSNAAAENAAQAQCGVRPKQVTSYLQSAAEQLNQANWLLSTYGTLQQRVTKLPVDAAGTPSAWGYVLSVSPSDLAKVTDQPMRGGPMSQGTFRVSQVTRKIAFGANGSAPEASADIVADPVPASMWS